MQSDSLRLHYLLHSADLIEERLHRQLAPLGIKPRQARILDALSRMDHASQVELARAFDVSPASMSTMTARLVAAGFITRQVDPRDPRSNTLRLSKKGSDLLDQIRAAWLAVDDIIESAIGPARARVLADITLDLRNALGGKTPGQAFETTPTNPNGD
jgi:DNA-binding MarR family transcriptional regulator